MATAERNRAQRINQPGRSLSTAAARQAARATLKEVLADRARRRRTRRWPAFPRSVEASCKGGKRDKLWELRGDRLIDDRYSRGVGGEAGVPATEVGGEIVVEGPGADLQEKMRTAGAPAHLPTYGRINVARQQLQQRPRR
jgi:hypothetical protein